MTQAEALDMVRRTISGTVLTFLDPLASPLGQSPIGDPLGQGKFLVGDANADTIMRALNAQGWSWVRR
jgi:hypothetical protein